MSNESIEFVEDRNDFVIRNIELTHSALWTPEDFMGRERFSATLETDNRDLIKPLVQRIGQLFADAGEKVDARAILQPGTGAKSFVRGNGDADREFGRDYSIVLRAAPKSPPIVLDNNPDGFRRIYEAEGEGITWKAVCNVIGGMFIVENKGKRYAYGHLRTVQIVEEGTAGAGAISADDAAGLLGGKLADDIGDYHTQGVSQPSGPGGPPAPRSNNRLPLPDDFDDDIPF